jgi:hypothetical protein
MITETHNWLFLVRNLTPRIMTMMMIRLDSAEHDPRMFKVEEPDYEAMHLLFGWMPTLTI